MIRIRHDIDFYGLILGIFLSAGLFTVSIGSAQSIQFSETRSLGVDDGRSANKSINAYGLTPVVITGSSLEGASVVSLGTGPSVNNNGGVAFTALREGDAHRSLALIQDVRVA